MEQLKHSKKRSSTKPVACCVCNRIFFNNVSLMLHFECHLKDDISTPKYLSLGLVPFSCSPADMDAAACARGLNNYLPNLNSTLSSSAASTSVTKTLTMSQLDSLETRINFSDARGFLLRQAAKSLTCGSPSASSSSSTIDFMGRGGKSQSKKANKAIPDIIILTDDDEGDAASNIDLNLKL